MKIKTNFNYLIIGFFFTFLLIGHLIFKDYLVTPDEPLHRINGFISLKYILEILSINFSSITQFENVPNLYSDWRKTYGVIFDLPLAIIEIIFKLNIQEAFQLRHYSIFIIFFISNIYFFLFLKKNLKDEKLALLGVMILITTPRIFSHSFFNGKDILFLSLMVIASYYCLELIKKYSFKNILLACVFCAFATNIRILGIYLPFLTCIFYFFLDNKFKTKKNNYFFGLFFFIYFCTLYIIWPFLWASPIDNFLLIFKESAFYPNHWNFKTLYLGNYFNPENLPWHYFFVWFFSTTPIIFLILILIGISIFLKKYLHFFLQLEFKKEIQIWKNKDQMISLFIFLSFFIPIFFVITINSTLYNGWRHLYFVYPSLIYLSLFGIKIFFELINNNTKRILLFFIILQIISNIFFIYKSHPIQNIYFNFVSKPLVKNILPVDYWGLGNKTTIDYLISKKKIFSVSNASFTPLINLKYSKKEDYSYLDNIEFLGTNENLRETSDFIFTNYYYNRSPKNLEKFKIPKNYKSYYKLIIDGITVNEVFIR